MTEQAGDIGFIRLLLEHEIVAGDGNDGSLIGVLGRRSLRRSIRLRRGGLGVPGAPTCLAREPCGARSGFGGHRRSVGHVVRPARRTDDRLPCQVIEARCARVAAAFRAEQRLHVSGGCSDCGTSQVLLPNPTAPPGEPRRRISVSSSVPLPKGVSSGFLELCGLLAAALSVVLERERDPVALVEHWEPRLLDGRRVYEYVLGAVLRGDEAESLGAVEELDCSGESHDEPFPLCVKEPVTNGPTLSPDDSGSGKGSAGDGLHLTKKGARGPAWTAPAP